MAQWLLLKDPVAALLRNVVVYHLYEIILVKRIHLHHPHHLTDVQVLNPSHISSLVPLNLPPALWAQAVTLLFLR